MMKLLDSKYAWGVMGLAAGMAIYHFALAKPMAPATP